jgi:uncharacterized protein (DUF488 family)
MSARSSSSSTIKKTKDRKDRQDADKDRHALTVYTIGHSTRTLDEFLGLLKAHGVTDVIDIRTIPRSRTNPQFNEETLPQALVENGIGYMHLPELGGLRRPRPDSPNQGWHNPSFRGFADYMSTDEFEKGLAVVLDVAARSRPALMCAEAVPWRCHRSLVADALVARGVHVEHILSERRSNRHVLRPWARLEGGRITYPADADQLFE